MIYIYDLILNWCRDKKYEFFEWKENDEIEYIKKIPIFKVKNFDSLFNNDIKVSKDFLNRIYNKTEVYGNKKIDKVEYACVFCDEELNKTFAIEFNDEGENLFKSIIYIYDIEDVFILGRRIDLLDLEFIILEKKEEKDIYLTREEIKKKKLLVNEIKSSYTNNNLDKLKYFYYEIFGIEIDDIDMIYDKLIDSLNNNFNYKHNVIYDVVNIPNF
ncbi:MAG: hypothetical protein E7162_03485 [Firmicutes bacterium]|nr:hypothetical protein [Bacillota bacterium]